MIEEGAFADLIVVDGDPIANIALVENPEKNFLIIMKDGKIYKEPSIHALANGRPGVGWPSRGPASSVQPRGSRLTVCCWTEPSGHVTKARPREAGLPEMSSLAISLVVTGVIVAGGVLGLVLQRVLPERYTMDKARDMIGGVVGQLTLLLVLVNGLLIWTAYGVYSTQQTELQTIAARALEFDLEMRQFGPEADEARSMLRTDLVWAHEQFWGDDTSRAAAYEASYKAMGSLNKFLDSLEPKTPAQTSLLAAARANYAFIGEQRLLMSLQAATPIPWPLIYAVTFWAVPPVRQHGAFVEIEPDVGCDARHGQRVDRACNLSDPRVQPALHQLDPRLAGAARTGDPSARPAERRKSERPAQ